MATAIAAELYSARALSMRISARPVDGSGTHKYAMPLRSRKTTTVEVRRKRMRASATAI